jgi:hypothetical protein
MAGKVCYVAARFDRETIKRKGRFPGGTQSDGFQHKEVEEKHNE